MKNILFALSLGLGGVIWATQYAHSEPVNCAERARVLERLEGDFGESRQSIGLGRNNAVVEVFASAETGTWTIIVTLPNGMSCLVASGESWEHLAEQARPRGQGA
jgi:hypothetical protein